MIICGQEEPLEVNQQIYMLDEDTGQIVLSDVEDQRLNRYSFVGLGTQTEVQSQVKRLLQALLSDLPAQAQRFSVHEYSTSDDHFKSLIWIMKRKKAYWNIQIVNSLVIASKPIEENMSVGFDSADSIYSELFLISGESFLPHALTTEVVLPTLYTFAKTGKLAPSAEFLSWLATQEYTFIYRERDVIGRIVIVVVGVAKVPTEAFMAQGIIQEIKVGSEATEVWQFSPKY